MLANNNTYNIDRIFDYVTLKEMVLESLKKMLREEISRQHHLSQQQQQPIINQHKIEEEEAITEEDDDDYNPNNNNSLPAPTLKLRIRNTTKYLNWRIAILRRDGFRCQVCSASIKDNKTLRLEVHHAKTFNEIFKENNITNIKQALECKEIWNLDNGVCLCYSCHKDIEKLRTKIRNVLLFDR
jgi:hypothetical protein